MQTIRQQESQPQDTHQTVEALPFILEKIGSQFNVEMLQLKLGITRANLYRYFFLRYRLSPMEFIWKLRGALALYQIARFPRTPISVINSQVGFNSAEHFSRRVKKDFGISPKEVKKSREVEFIFEFIGELLLPHGQDLLASKHMMHIFEKEVAIVSEKMAELCPE